MDLQKTLARAAVTGSACAAALVTLAFAAPAQAAEPVVTPCDQMAAHPDDPDKIGPGSARSAIDLPKAIEACRAAVAADPGNLRLRYQLSRVLFYSGDRAESVAGMKSAADGGYRQAQFVYGVFINYQRDGAPKDLCLAEQYWAKSAVAGRQAARVNYVRERLAGRFDGCANMPSKASLQGLMTSAEKDSTNYYEGLFIKDLAGRLATAPNIK